MLEILNTPIAVLAAVLVIVTLNAFLYFGYYLPRTTTPSASQPQAEHTTTLERTNVEKTQPKEETRPRNIFEETTTSSATATATASP